MGLSSPIGKRFRWNNLEEGTIIGVVKDYHQESLHHEIKPSVLIRQYGYWPEFCIKISPVNMNETLNYIGSVWKKFEGESVPFSYKFLDETLDNMYKSEKRTGSIIKFFTSLTIFISCLGLFGLASITAIQRKKEIAIRKLLGASKAGINLVLSKEFVKWVVISNGLAWPVAWIVMNKWLENFAYKTSLNIMTFILAGTVSLGISLFSVIFQTFKATAANPADSLRNE